MKKFTFMLIAAFMATAAWAQPAGLNSRHELPGQFAVKTAANFKMAPEKMEVKTPRKPLTKTVKAANAATQKAARMKAPRRVTDLNALAQTYLVKNNVYTLQNSGTEEVPAYELVPVTIPRATQTWEITLISDKPNTVSITGIDGGDKPVEATVDVETGTISIAYGQVVSASESYGNIVLASATGAESLVGSITDEGIFFQDYWYTAIAEGPYAGYAWSDIYASQAVLPNGTMTFTDSGDEVEANVAIDFDEESHTATVWNFGDMGFTVDVKLKSGGKFVIYSQLVEEGGETYGDFYTCALDAENSPTDEIFGTGTENTLTFGSNWTFYATTTGYWYGALGAATITSNEAIFTYPVIVEAPATPADPSVLAFSYYDEELGYATATVNVPATDVDGNELITSMLAFQLYTMDAAGAPVAITEPIAYEAENIGTGSKKTVALPQNYEAIAVKSIYTAAGETNESALSAWYAVPQLVSVPEGLELKEYPIAADARYSSGWNVYKGTALVGISGEDVYIQGILPQCPKGWAKGTISGNTVTLPALQCMGSYNGEYIYLTGINPDTYEATDITFAYNAEEDIYVSEDLIIGNVGTEEIGSFFYPYMSGMTLGTESVPELVQLPENAEVVEYPFMGNTYADGTATEFETTVNVAVVDDEVYVQGINDLAPEVWVKGTKNEEGNIVFATGQNFGLVQEEDYYGEVTATQYFMVGYDMEKDAISDVVMTYDADENYYELKNELLVNGKKLSVYYHEWFMAGSTIGQKVTYNDTFNFNAMDVPTSTNAATDGDILSDTTIVSQYATLTITPALEGKTANRYWSTKNGPQLRVYSNTLTFATTNGAEITKIDFSNNTKWNEGNTADSGQFDGTVWTGSANTVVVTIAGNTQLNAINVTYKVASLPALTETVAPEDMETSDWKVQATEIVYVAPQADEETGQEDEEAEGTFEPEAYKASIQVGFYTAEGAEGTEVYIQGLCPELPNAWVKAPLVDGKVTIPYSTYFGLYETIDWSTFSLISTQMFLTSAVINPDMTYNLADVVFDYDAEAGKLTTEQDIFVNGNRRALEYYHWYEGMTITKIADVAATPADPEIPEEDGLITVGTDYPKIMPVIKTVDIDGNDLLVSKLAYTIWVEKEGGAQQLTFTTDLYQELEQDMTEIPYSFGDGWDIFANGETVYFNQGTDEISTWTKVGVQSIYYGGGECNKSNIVWAENPAYGTVVGISELNAGTDAKTNVVFDLQGRRVAKAAKGLYIVNGKKTVLK